VNFILFTVLFSQLAVGLKSFRAFTAQVATVATNEMQHMADTLISYVQQDLWTQMQEWNNDKRKLKNDDIYPGHKSLVSMTSTG
jgi:hypothetical protein